MGAHAECVLSCHRSCDIERCITGCGSKSLKNMPAGIFGFLKLSPWNKTQARGCHADTVETTVTRALDEKLSCLVARFPSILGGGRFQASIEAFQQVPLWLADFQAAACPARTMRQ